ncbi:MAG TPA: FtsX-like permease family protein [bacterium]|nr:FtsX-like permease family protein [bacterium]
MTKLTLRNLFRNKRRTFLTVGSVSIAIFLLCLLLTMLASMQNTESSAENRVVMRSKISLTFDLPESYWERVKTLPHVTAVTPLNWYQGVYIDDRPEHFFPRFTSDPETIFDVFPEYQISEEEKATWRAERDSFIAGQALVDKFGWKIGDRIQIKGDIYPVDINIVLRGIFHIPENTSQERQIYFHRRYLEEALNNPGTVGTYWLLVDSPDNVPAVITAAEAMFANSEMQVRAETEQAFQLSFLEMLGNVRLLFGAIGTAVIISIFFITANTMAMIARERTTEVAVLKTLGFRRHHVISMVLGESVAVGLAGAALGCLLAYGLLKMTAVKMADSFPFFGTLALPPNAVLLAIGTGLLVGLLSGALPAMSAARLRIAEGIRRVA